MSTNVSSLALVSPFKKEYSLHLAFTSLEKMNAFLRLGKALDLFKRMWFPTKFYCCTAEEYKILRQKDPALLPLGVNLHRDPGLWSNVKIELYYHENFLPEKINELNAYLV